MSPKSSELLAAYFPVSAVGSSSPRQFDDIEIEHIASLLEDHEESWSRVPRTYIVLRTIGHLDLLNELLQLGFTDHWFPVEASALPPRLQPSVRNAIVKAQSIILTKSVDLEKGENGRHWHFAKGEPQPFKVVRLLGSGGYSQVYRIRSTISFKEYALKRMRRRRIFGNNSQESLRQFITEMNLLKSLRHKHIAEYIGSFTDPSYLGLIMAPIADMNLSDYLDSVSTQPGPVYSQTSELITLRSFFGCLASALQYLHSQSIRHRDIKPQNILVDGSNVLFTDFGLSKEYSPEVGSTTSGATSMTPRYAAPEVLFGDPRNTSSDVWSLGCVFLEMVAVIKGRDVPFLKRYFLSNGSMQPFACRNPTAVATLLQELEILGKSSDNMPLLLTKRMLEEERTLRPTAAEVFSVMTTPEDGDSAIRFCGLCCLDEDASDSHDSLCEDPDTSVTINSVINPFDKVLHDERQMPKSDTSSVTPFPSASPGTMATPSSVNTPFSSDVHASNTVSSRIQEVLVVEASESRDEGIDLQRQFEQSEDEKSVFAPSANLSDMNVVQQADFTSPMSVEDDSTRLSSDSATENAATQLQMNPNISFGNDITRADIVQEVKGQMDQDAKIVIHPHEVPSRRPSPVDTSQDLSAYKRYVRSLDDIPLHQTTSIITDEAPASEVDPSMSEVDVKASSSLAEIGSSTADKEASESKINASPSQLGKVEKPYKSSRKKLTTRFAKIFRLPRSSDDLIKDIESQPAKGVFGIHPDVSIRYANVAISLFDKDGNSFICGYIPIVLAKCGIFLKEKAIEVEEIFLRNGDEKRISQLQHAFDSPERRYGKGLDLSDCSTHDIANVLVHYFKSLPEPIISASSYESFIQPLRTETLSFSFDEGRINPVNPEKWTWYYKLALADKVSPVSRQVMLYLLDLLAVFVLNSDRNKMTTARLVQIFHEAILGDRHKPEPDHTYALLYFLIENNDEFLSLLSIEDKHNQAVAD